MLHWLSLPDASPVCLARFLLGRMQPCRHVAVPRWLPDWLAPQFCHDAILSRFSFRPFFP